MHAFFRIYTENKNRDIVLEECRNMLKGFAIVEGIGVWKGVEELSLTIEAVLPYNVHSTAVIRSLAEAIKHLNNQGAVLVTISPLIDSTFV